MIRLTPEQYKLEAHVRVEAMGRAMTCAYGEWSMRKIMDEIERILRDKRRKR